MLALTWAYIVTVAALEVGALFGIITRQTLRRGTHRSVTELIEAIERFIDGLERPLRTLCMD